MARILLAFALIIATATAFVAPVNNAVARPAFARSYEAPKMILDVSSADLSVVADSTNLIATKVNEYGALGNLFPVFGLVILGGIIVLLSPPLKDE